MIPAISVQAAAMSFSESSGPSTIGFRTWTWPPLIVLPLLIVALIYLVGIFRMRKHATRPHRDLQSIIYFGAGWTSLLLALDSPLHELSEQLFWVHMTQHEILMLISAPLLILGRPVAPFLWCLSPKWRRKVGGVIRVRFLGFLWNRISTPGSAWILHAAALWLWHIPFLFDAALAGETMHAAQHISFLGSALLFWFALIDKHSSRSGWGMAALYVFTTAIHTSLLGALLTFSSFSWYRPYASTAPAWGLTALQDQQLGGLIMWIPAGTFLLLITLVFFARWMAESDRRLQYMRTASTFGVSVEESSDAD
jgi:putative membrane protein